MAKLKVKKGDQVVVRTGKDKGRTGPVIDVRPSEGRIKVQGINMVTRHRRPTQSNAGGIEKMEAPIHISNVALIDPETVSADAFRKNATKMINRLMSSNQSGNLYRTRQDRSFWPVLYLYLYR